MATSESASFIRCWVLHRRPYRNTSVIVDFFGGGVGRLGAIARGGQREPLVQPFKPLLVQLRGRGELRTLTAVEPAGAASALVGDALYCGLYLNEILVRLLHRDDPQPELLPIYEHTLTALAADRKSTRLNSSHVRISYAVFCL